MVSFLKRLLLLRVRKNKRYKAKTGVYVIYEQSFMKNQVDTLSMGGLSFYYVDNGHRIDSGSFELSLVTRNRLSVGSIPFKTVSDLETGEILFQNKRIKRQSVQFEHLSITQKNRLKEIIRNYTTK